MADLKAELRADMAALEIRLEHRLTERLTSSLTTSLTSSLTSSITASVHRSLSADFATHVKAMMEHMTSLFRGTADHTKAIEDRLDAHIADRSVHRRPRRAPRS